MKKTSLLAVTRLLLVSNSFAPVAVTNPMNASLANAITAQDRIASYAGGLSFSEGFTMN